MPWTPLHAALGETSTELTFDMIERAIALRIEETASLDWKGRLPLASHSNSTGPEEKQSKVEELAKDVAAMANSGGGIIVYGVDEQTVDGREAAGKLFPVGEITSNIERDIRATANNLIYPPVTGTDFYRLHPEGNPAGGVLVLHVPDSQDAPHLVHPKKSKDWFQSPWRDGPHTRFMGERQLADSYRRREQARREHGAELADIYENFAQAVGAQEGSHVWVIVAGRPSRPLARSRRLDIDASWRITDRAIKLFHWTRQDETPLRLVADESHGRGLRLFFRQLIGPSDGDGPMARIEVHSDGSLALGLSRGGVFGKEKDARGQVPVRDLESVPLDMVALMLELQREVGLALDYELQIGVSPSTEIFREQDPGGGFVPFFEQQRVRNFLSVRGTVVGNQGRLGLLQSATECIEDVVNQTGGVLRWSAQGIEEQLPRWSSASK